MPIVVECPQGHKSYVRDEHAGKKAKCPVCGAVVRVPDPPAAPTARDAITAARPVARSADEPQTVEPLDAPEPPRRKKGRSRSRKGALDKVHRGLGYHYAKQILLLISLLLSLCQIIFLGPKLSGLGAAEEEGTVRPILFGALNFVLLIALIARSVMGIMGSIQCAAVPEKSGARGFIITALLLDFLTLPLPVVTKVFDLGVLLNVLFSLMENVLGLVSWIMFMLFLRKLAYYLDADQCGDDALQLILKGLFFLIGIPVALVAGLFIAIITCMRGFGAFLVAVVILGILLINFLFEVLALIGRVRLAIRPEQSATVL